VIFSDEEALDAGGVKKVEYVIVILDYLLLISTEEDFVYSNCRLLKWQDELSYERLHDTTGVPRQYPHRHSGLANLPSVGAVP